MYNEIDYERLRNDLIDYFGTAMTYYPVAVIELSEVERATDSKLEQIAIQIGFNLNNYIKQKSR